MGLTDMMHQSVADAHGKADEIVCELRAQTDHLTALVEAVQASNQRANFRRIPLTANADANGYAAIIVPVPAGFGWDLVSIAASGGAPTVQSACSVYLGSPDPMNLIHVLSYGVRMSDEFSAQEYAPALSTIIIEWTGQPVNQYVAANLKVEVLDETPYRH